MYIAVVNWNNDNRIIKRDFYEVEQDADDFVANLTSFPDAFVSETLAGGLRDWLVDPVAKTLSFNPILDDHKTPVINAINDLRDAKKALPILTEGYLVDPGTLSTGAMAVEMFAYTKSDKVIASLTSSGNVATAVFDKNHHLKDDSTITVSGVTNDPKYNVPGIVTKIDKKTITYPIAGPATSPATGSPIIGVGTYRWITSDNQIVFWTVDEFDEIFQACTEYLDECQLRGRTLKDAVLAATTVAEIESIDITAGWPSTGN